MRTDRVNLLLYQSNINFEQNPLLPSSPLSKELVVYTSFLYSSSDNGSFVIFLIGASQRVYKSRSIVGCGVGKNIATRFKVRYIYEDIRLYRWLRKLHRPKQQYQQLAVECYGIDIEDKDPSFLLFHNSTLNLTVMVHSDQPMVVPAPRVPPKYDSNVTSVVCTKALSRGVSWLPEFLRYQKTLGVDHVHVAILDTFIKDQGFRDILANDSFFMRGVKEGFITVQVWKEWYQKDEWFYYGNILMYLDCIYRYRGTYDFVSLLDTDDFFTIRVPNLSYNDFLVKYCYKEGIGSCSLKWEFYYPGICGMKKDVGEDGNVTASMIPHMPTLEQRTNHKPIHLTKAIRDSSFHDASCSECLLKGYRAIIIPENIAYVAHNRLHVNKSKKEVCNLI